MAKIGFIGTGNMGSAIAKCIVTEGKTVFLSNRTIAKAKSLSLLIDNSVVSTNEEIAEKCDLIFLSVKPQMMESVLTSISSILQNRNDSFVLCTMAASLTCKKILAMANVNCPIIRIMPNTPCEIGCGVVQYCGQNVSNELLKEFADLIQKAGLVDLIDENKIDAASAVSGCGPAFVYMFIEALADGGVACGLTRAQAIEYAAKMVEGSAKMVLETHKHPGALKDAVCSPAGTTIQGVKALEENGFRGATMNAVIAAYEKTLKLK